MTRRSPLPAQIELARSVRSLRKGMGITQTGLAERTGGVQGHISGIERGTYDPRASTLVAIATALGCELMLVPKARAAEMRWGARSDEGGGTPPSLFDEVFIPDPDDADAD